MRSVPKRRIPDCSTTPPLTDFRLALLGRDRSVPANTKIFAKVTLAQSLSPPRATAAAK